MGKKLAIRGNSARGKEVIELLEIMGGENPLIVSGYEPFNLYYINDKGVINYKHHSLNKDMIVFTLEEFLNMYSYKVGDIVKTGKDEEGVIKQMRWVNNNIVYWVNSHKTCDWTQTLSVDVLDKYNRLNSNDVDTKIEYPGRSREDVLFDGIIWHLRNSINNGKQNLSGGECEKYFREIVKKNNENKMKNILAELLEHIKTTPKEDLEREFNELEEWSNVGPTVEEFMAFCECINKKPVYPKLTNLSECKEILGEKDMYQSVSGYKGELLTNFQLLFIFRDVYLKIAGEQIGLGKPWEPDWSTKNERKYVIEVYCNNVRKNSQGYSNTLLAFPTEEMRDAFYENFKDLIYSCKELL